jgi:rRNA-processing protein FCF1
MRVLLDTSFIITAFACKIDIMTSLHRLIDDSIQIAMIDKTQQELKGKPLASLILQYLENHHVHIIPTPQDKNVDNLILDNLTPDTIVATQDKKLKERLKKRKTTILTIRQKRYIALV